jgi:Family of unknown function (DUF5324)
MTDSHLTVSRLHLPTTVTAAEPWLRDHYDVLRTEVGPRWDRTRAAVAPAMDGAMTRLRDDVAPTASQAVNRLTQQAARRSAPLRNETTNRRVATMAALRGHVSAADVARIEHRSRNRRLWLLGAATGAAMAAGLVVWQRMRNEAWVEDDAVLSALTDEDSGPRTEPGMPRTGAGAGNASTAQPRATQPDEKQAMHTSSRDHGRPGR